MSGKINPQKAITAFLLAVVLILNASIAPLLLSSCEKSPTPDDELKSKETDGNTVAAGENPDGSENIPGATFGNTRKNADGTDKFHNGIDLAGAVGTPIYAQFDGTISGNPVTNQPNRPYPSDYQGDTNGAGNRINIDSTIDGSTVSFGYWHLQAGNPIARNPRTGWYWVSGDSIYAGELIGYIGITGNADANVPHLHLTNGADTNPTTYLNATVSTTTRNITTPCN